MGVSWLLRSEGPCLALSVSVLCLLRLLCLCFCVCFCVVVVAGSSSDQKAEWEIMPNTAGDREWMGLVLLNHRVRGIKESEGAPYDRCSWLSTNLRDWINSSHPLRLSLKFYTWRVHLKRDTSEICAEMTAYKKVTIGPIILPNAPLFSTAFFQWFIPHLTALFPANMWHSSTHSVIITANWTRFLLSVSQKRS